jgi:branched-subunit amino acid ABC-type transport system permease component
VQFIGANYRAAIAFLLLLLVLLIKPTGLFGVRA